MFDQHSGPQIEKKTLKLKFRRDLFDCDLVGLASSNGLKFSAFETVWIIILTGSFKPLQSSKFPFFKICLNFPLSNACRKNGAIFLPPTGRLELFWLPDCGALTCRTACGGRLRTFHAQILPSTEVRIVMRNSNLWRIVAIFLELTSFPDSKPASYLWLKTYHHPQQGVQAS